MPPAWPHTPNGNGADKSSEAVALPVRELIDVMPAPPADTDDDYLEADPADDVAEVLPYARDDHQVDFEPIRPIDVAELVPQEQAARPASPPETRIEEVTERIEAAWRDSRPGDADSVASYLDGTQADLVTLILGTMQQDMEIERRDKEPETPALEAPAQSDPDELLKSAKADPSILYDRVNDAVRRPPVPGSVRDIIQNADPRLALKEEMQKGTAKYERLSPEEKAAREQERKQRETMTEEDFFKLLLLRREPVDGEEESESDMVWRLQHAPPEKDNTPEESKKTIAAIIDKTKKARDAMSDFAVYKGPQGLRAQQRSEKAEEIRVRNLYIQYNSLMRNKDHESALTLVEGYINRINNSFIDLQESKASPKDRFNQTARDKAYSLPGHVDRLKAFAEHAWRVRWTHGPKPAADEGFANNFELLVRIAERADEHGDFANAQDKDAYRSGDRSTYISPETTLMKATLAVMRIHNELAHNQDHRQAMEATAKELRDIYKAYFIKQQTAWMAQNPGATVQGEQARITGKELEANIEVTALLYKLALSQAGPMAAEQVLEDTLQALTERLDGELELDALEAANGPASQLPEKFTDYSLDRLKEFEAMLAMKMREEALKRGGRATHRTERAYKAVFAARAAREKGNKELDKEYKDYESQAAREYNEQVTPGGVTVISGANEKADGQYGAITIGMAAHGATRAEISGNSKFAKGTVRNIGAMAIVDTGVTLPKGDCHTLIVEGRVSPRITPDILEQVRPNGVCLVPASLNPGLAAQIALQISPEWYRESHLPELVARYATAAEQKKVEQTRQAQTYRSTVGSTYYGEGYRCALLPSTTCRFTVTEHGVQVEQGHAREIAGRPPEWTLVICRDIDGLPSNLYGQLVSFSETAAA